jgi:phage nucleotide-binding protein
MPARKRSLPTSPTKPAVKHTDYLMLFYGPPGVGKTTFVNKFGRVLFLSTDRGTRFISTMRMECHKFEDFILTLAELKRPGNVKHYDLVCIDHVDDFANMAELYVCERLGIEALSDAGYGKGWSMYRKTMANYIQSLLRLNLGVMFIAHETIKTVRTRTMELERIMPSLSKSAANVVLPLCDLIGYCGFRTIKQSGKRKEVRTLETKPREDLHVKDRTSRRRSELELLDGEKFINSFKGTKHNGEKESHEKEDVTKVKRGRRARSS